MLEPTTETIIAMGYAAEQRIAMTPDLDHPVADVFLTGLALGLYIGQLDVQEARNFLRAGLLPEEVHQELYQWATNLCREQ